MSIADLLLRLRALRSRRRAEAELDEEIQFHLAMEARKLRQSGMDGGSARTEFGGVDQFREECRDVRGLTPLENLGRDLHYGLRMLRKSPVFTAVAVLSLAIGIGANTAVFTLVDAVLLRLLPVRNPEELVVLKWGARKAPDLRNNFSSSGRDARGRRVQNTFSWKIFNELRAHARTIHDVIGFFPLAQINVAVNNQALLTGGVAVSGNYFSALGVPMLIGRPFTADDETAAGAPAAIISYCFWERTFALDPAAVGRTIVVNAVPCTIVGVTPKGFDGVSPGGFSRTPDVDITVPIRTRTRMDPREDIFEGHEFWVQIMGRRAPQIADAAVEAEVAAAVAANLPEDTRRAMAAGPPYALADSASRGLAGLRDRYRDPLLIIMAVVALTLLMACANLAGLLLARASARRREIMVRMALGAKRSRLIRQLLAEGALLSAAGALAGCAVAWAGVRGLLALIASGKSPVVIEVSPDTRILAFTAAVSLLTTFLFALAPAVRATRVDVAHGLKEDTPASAGQRFGAVRALVSVQIAVALLLVAGAVLLQRTLVNLRSVSLGFNAGNLVLFDIAPGRSGYDETRALELYRQAADRLRQSPGVAGVTLAYQRLLAGWMANGPVRLNGDPRDSHSNINFVGPDYFEVMQIPLAAGRTLGLRDLTGPRAAVVNETFVRSYIPEGSPLGRHFRWRFGNTRDEVEIVGIARDARYQSLRGEVPATVYVPYTQIPFGWPQQMSVAIRTAGPVAPAVATVRRTMSGIDRMLPLIDLKTQQVQIDEQLGLERLFAWLVSLFGGIALALACVGLYGLVSASVVQRTREIGVRMALGAGRGAVLRMLLGQTALTACAGLMAGMGAAWAFTRVVESQLFGVKPHDAASLALAAGVVVAIALAAALWPAHKATRIDPVKTLRYE
jgi:predicted permease